MVMYDAAPAPSADAAQPAEPPATDDLVERLRNKGDYERSLHIDRYAAADLIERQAREIERWRNVTARADPDDCAAGIKELYGRWKDAEADRGVLRECIEWALGEGEDFPNWPDTVTITGNPKFWWRKELLRRFDAARAKVGK